MQEEPGTTTVRALESAALSGRLEGRAELFIRRPWRWRAVDVLLTPTCPTVPPAIEEGRRALAYTRYTTMAAFAGLPAASIPAATGHLGTFPSHQLMGLLLAHAGRLAKYGA